MNLPSLAASGLDSQYPTASLERVGRLNFIHDDGRLERVDSGHALAHDSGNAAILVWTDANLGELPDWVVPGQPGEVNSIVAASDDGEVEASFDVTVSGARNGDSGAVFLQYEGA